MKRRLFWSLATIIILGGLMLSTPTGALNNNPPPTCPVWLCGY
jgi:hypothetical protein